MCLGKPKAVLVLSVPGAAGRAGVPRPSPTSSCFGPLGRVRRTRRLEEAAYEEQRKEEDYQPEG